MNKKTIWITGGSTGIGRALAIKFASKGWNVAVSARRVELLNELSNSYENISAFPLDVTDKSKCKEVFNEIKNKFENIDICFFSTGTWNPKKEKDIDVEQMEDVFKVNFFGTVNSIKAVEEYFRNKKSNMVTGHGKDEETMCAEYKVSSVEVQKISNQFRTEIEPKENQAEVS